MSKIEIGTFADVLSGWSGWNTRRSQIIERFDQSGVVEIIDKHGNIVDLQIHIISIIDQWIKDNIEIQQTNIQKYNEIKSAIRTILENRVKEKSQLYLLERI